jgi:hypothetical protein
MEDLRLVPGRDFFVFPSDIARLRSLAILPS